ncbi:inorganic phosphate transporter [Peptococcus simiae]|uniref:inorganic phosphate transporter n=1 Tax=Peptococcus simiae TaxID=1643805 RepID=UPI003980B500
MADSLLVFLQDVTSSPAYAITAFLVLAVIFVNGWTDAPNAIATCVSTRAMRARPAILMAAVFNFLGVLIMTMVSAGVAETIFNMVDFRGEPYPALLALCAALFAIVIWAVASWYFGIPTSESHALIAGISGAAIALQGGISGINGNEWIKVIYGLILSVTLGFLMGWCIVRLVGRLFRNTDRRRTAGVFRGGQIASAAAMAFMHGAQDGQKFMGVFMLGMFLARGENPSGSFTIPLWLMILCSAVMGIGTSIGGYRIIKSVGMDMVKIKQWQGFSADVAGSLVLLIATLVGFPVSTTQTKTTAIMGVGAGKSLSSVRWDLVRNMALTWLITFPGCGLIGFCAVKAFAILFA